MTPTTPDLGPLIVVGASARAVAASAARLGWRVHTADLFADADLRAAATVVVRVPTGPGLPWPDGLEACVGRFPHAPWIYTGALENHPDLVDRIARARPLAGNPGARLRAVRDPVLLARAVRAAGVTFPDTFTDATALPTDGSFIVKPLASAGGHGIAPWHGGVPSSRARVWQRFVPGRTWSAAFALGAGGPRLFGASRQLVGRPWCGARGFTWCGAVDLPLDTLAPRLRSRLDRLGTVLHDTFGLVGLVGVDLVVDRAGEVHVIEANPRPTASLELVERATGASVAATHLDACGMATPSPSASAPRGRIVWTKAVVFADVALAVDADVAAALAALAAPWGRVDGWPALADLPAPGTTLAAGAPALTVFAPARDASAAMRTLRGRVAAVREALRSRAVSRPAGGAARPPPPGSTA
ncbi:MAG: ATP-grasp domain-containing protein [Planctomycetaceae bacterium]